MFSPSALIVSMPSASFSTSPFSRPMPMSALAARLLARCSTAAATALALSLVAACASVRTEGRPPSLEEMSGFAWRSVGGSKVLPVTPDGTAEEIRRREEDRHTPIIFLTALDRLEASLGADRCVENSLRTELAGEMLAN